MEAVALAVLGLVVTVPDPERSETMYRWDDMGLKNVWLANGYALQGTPYGRGVSFKDVEGLVNRHIFLE